jgi:protein-tyrosine phosphatase
MDQMPSQSPATIVVLCSANQCRSPMAQVLLLRRLATLNAPVTLRSAGLLRGGDPPPAEVVSAMAGYGLDVAPHRSRLVTPADLAQADLILGMAREHVRHAVVLAPPSWPRAFTLKELVRRGKQTGPRMPGEPLADWLSRVHEGRTHAALLGASPLDDVADPVGGPPRAYALTAALLDELVTGLAELCWGLRADSLPGQL